MKEVAEDDATNHRTASDVLTVEDLAQYLNVSPSYVYMNVERLPHARLGKLIRFFRPAIDNWRANGGTLNGKPLQNSHDEEEDWNDAKVDESADRILKKLFEKL